MVNLPKLESTKDNLINSLLQLSLNKVQANICYEISNEIITEARKAKLIQQDEISLQWARASSTVDDFLLHAEQPIFKGGMGGRLFVIRNSDSRRQLRQIIVWLKYDARSYSQSKFGK